MTIRRNAQLHTRKKYKRVILNNIRKKNVMHFKNYKKKLIVKIITWHLSILRDNYTAGIVQS